MLVAHNSPITNRYEFLGFPAMCHRPYPEETQILNHHQQSFYLSTILYLDKSDTGTFFLHDDNKGSYSFKI